MKYYWYWFLWCVYNIPSFQMAAIPHFVVCRTLLANVREEQTERSLIDACSYMQIYLDGIKSSSSESGGTVGDQNYQEFIKTMLNENWVMESSKMLGLLYATFHSILKALNPENLKIKIYNSQFVRSFGECFIRDINKFQDISGLLMGVAYFFIAEIKSSEPVSDLEDIGFHKAVVCLFDQSDDIETVIRRLEVLATLIDKHFDYLKDVKLFNETKVPFTLLDKILLFNSDIKDSHEESFKACYEAVIYMLTEDVDISKDLVKNGFMEKLVPVFQLLETNGIRTAIVFSLGRLIEKTAEGKQRALDLQIHRLILAALEKEDNLRQQFIITSCEILKDLILSDGLKYEYIQHGVMSSLLRILQHSGEDTDAVYSVLNVLYGISDISLVNRSAVATREAFKSLLPILNHKDHTNVFIAILILIQLGELDMTTVTLRELGLVELLVDFIRNPKEFKTVPFMEENMIKIVEEECLFTISRKNCPGIEVSSLTSDEYDPLWPPKLIGLQKQEHLPIISSSSFNPSVTSLKEESIFKSKSPISPELSATSRLRLTELGVDISKPLFHLGRLFGNTCHVCKNCDEAGKFISYFIIRPHGLTSRQYQQLVDCGWYRTGNVEFLRTCHNHKVTCYNWETRVMATKFNHNDHKSFKKVLKRMPLDRLSVKRTRAQFNKEAFNLYNDYQVKQHSKPKESEYSYTEHVVNSPFTHELVDGVECGTFHELYYLDGKLAAVSVYDVIPKGIISIYMWYDVNKEVSKYSFGKYTILKEIERVKLMSETSPDVEYYYLQGWNETNKKLSYKADYEPAEFYCPCVVSNWVQGLESINQAREDLEKLIMIKEPGSDDKLNDDNQEDSPPPQKKSKLEEEIIATEQQSSNAAKNFISQAFPLDNQRYRASCSEALDISKVVVCLNRCIFVSLGELCKHLTDEYQRKVLDTRIKDLYVALTPELRRQLVIDIVVTR